MSLQKILLPSILAGVVIFLWGFVSHMFLGFGEVGMKSMPNEEIVLAAMRENVPESGLYFFPGMPKSPNATSEQQEAMMQQWYQKIHRGPTGLLVYTSSGTEALSPTQLLVEFLSNLLAAFIAAAMLGSVVNSLPRFSTRVSFVALLGLLAGIIVDVSYWNWYKFPGSYTLATMIDNTVGFFLAGLVLAWRIKPAPTSEQTERLERVAV